MAVTGYKVRSTKKDGGTSTVYVEAAERSGRGEGPSSAGNDKIILDELTPVVDFAAGVLEQFKTLDAKALKIEFGVELGGSNGNPFVTQGLGKATFKVTLDWHADA